MKVKTLLLCTTCLLFSYGFSLEIPDDIEKKITNQARRIFSEPDEKASMYEFVSEQKNAYGNIYKELEQSGLLEKEQEKILNKLGKNYPNNFTKQYIKLLEEIVLYKENKIDIEKKVNEKIDYIISSEKIRELEKEKNMKYKEEVEALIKNSLIPKEVMNHFEKEAKKLYPGNYYEQNKYLKSSLSNYNFIKNIK
ncbi:MAG: hypothetical protein ACRC0S_09650 [Fusobacteriaceae bacterium]